MSAAPADALAARLARVARVLAAQELDALLVTHLPNIFYLTGFRATAGALVVRPNEVRLVADRRYLLSAELAVQGLGQALDAKAVPVESSIDEAAAEVLKTSGAKRVGIEAASLSVKRFDWLAASLGRPSASVSLVSTERVVEQARAVKDDFEIAVLRQAGRLLSEVADGLAMLATAGRSERMVAADLDDALRRRGFERPAFETIVASGPNSALPHARPGDRRLQEGDPVVLDFGGVYDGYCVDLTRTLSVGTPKDELVRLHEAVREAQAAALAAARPGIRASAVDAAARFVLSEHGLAEAFSHGTGHGLGVEVHEDPRIGRPVAGLEDAVIEPGMVFTLEPGVYVPGVGGVRLEDDVLVTARGCELLTHVSQHLTG